MRTIVFMPAASRQLDALRAAAREAIEAALAAEAEEDAADVATFDAAMAEIAARGDSPLPVEVSASLLHGARLLTAIRKWRGVKQIELAERAGLSQGYLSDLESRRRKGGKEALAAIAKALDVPANWLI